MKIDAHQHFWQIARGDYCWLTPQCGSIYRDFLPEDFLEAIAGKGIDGSVLVQAAPTVAETQYLLDLADQYACIKGVVGWVDFESPDVIEDIRRFATHPKFVGIRPMIQDIEDDGWMLQEKFTSVFDTLKANELVFDALTLPRHLKFLGRLLRRHPALRVVIDHGSKPQIREKKIDEWAKDMSMIADSTSAFCKISGLITEAGENWTAKDIKPYTDHLLACFGPDRLIWGSDWPVSLLAGSYERWLETTKQLFQSLTSQERSAILGDNAVQVYTLPN